ncbi:MAG: class I SAM-dependent methyltransferase [Lachnospiraceae bacterium]|nr:class I SAM-dependent methyltransferase [Lachnospiraceae bacterium]
MSSKLFYNLTAWAYGLLDVIYFNNYERSPRRAVLDAINSEDTVLDMCTGTGINALKIAESFPHARVIGVDLSHGMLKIARENAKKVDIENVKFYRMDATDMKFKDRCFYKVSIALVLHETDEELAGKLILEAKRVLKDDGEIIITEWEPSKQLWRRVLFAPITLLEPKPYKDFVKKDLDDYFKKFGLEVVETKHCDYTKVLRIRKAGLDL